MTRFFRDVGDPLPSTPPVMPRLPWPNRPPRSKPKPAKGRAAA